MKNSDVYALPVDDGLVLMRRDSVHLYALNESGRFVWEQFQGGVPESEIPRRMVERYGIEEDRARQDFAAAKWEWEVRGLIDIDAPDRQFRIAGLTFRVFCQTEEIDAAVGPVIDHLRAADGGADNRRSAMDLAVFADDGHFVVYRDGAETCRARDIDAAVEKVASHVVMLLFEKTRWLMSIHASVAAHDGGCVLFPAATGSGKSTLTAALLARGYTYVTDDFALIEGDEFTVLPMPGAMMLKSGSWPVLEPLLGDLATIETRLRRGQETRYWIPPKAQHATQPMPVKAIVFPRYAPESETRIDRVSPVEALNGIIKAPSSLTPPISGEEVEKIRDWIVSIPAYALQIADLTEAADLAEDILRS